MTDEQTEPNPLQWMQDAPTRFGAGVAAATVELGDGQIIPALTFVFRSPNDADEPITVTLIAEAAMFREFQKRLDKAITAATRQVRARLSLRVAGNGKLVVPRHD